MKILAEKTDSFGLPLTEDDSGYLTNVDGRLVKWSVSLEHRSYGIKDMTPIVHKIDGKEVDAQIEYQAGSYPGLQPVEIREEGNKLIVVFQH